MHRKVTVLWLFCLLLCTHAKADVTVNDPVNARAYAPTPKAYEQIRYGNVSRIGNTGAIGLELPVGEYSDHDFSLPVFLKYRYDGFRPLVPSGEAGLGWSLDVGGAITREIVGVDDFSGSGYYNQSVSPLDEAVYDMTMNVSLLENGLPSLDGTHETTSDIYHFYFPGHSGSFVVDRNGEFVCYSTSGEKGTYDITYNNGAFTVKTPDGKSWRFGATHLSRELMLVQNGILETYPHQLSELYGELPTVTWLLDRVTAPDGREMSFAYTSSRSYNSIPSEGDDVLTTISRSYNSTKYKNASLVYTSYLTGVTVKETDGAVKTVASFTWSRKNYKEIDAYPVPDYAYSKMVVYTRRLDGISISDGETILRTASLLYDDSRGRPLLTSVTVPVAGTWSFEYNLPSGDGALPGQLSNAVDFWGYYNGKVTNSDTFIYPVSVNAYSLNEYLTTYMMDPDSEYGVLGSISKVYWPTGGSTSIQYESHDASEIVIRPRYPRLQPIPDTRSVPAPFTTSLESATVILHNNLCGGIRVRAVLSDNLTDAPHETRFEYKSAGGASSGIIQEFNRYLAGKVGTLDVFNPYLKYPNNSFGQSHIAYKEITEIYADSSSVRTQYTSWADFPDDFSPHSIEITSDSYNYGETFDLFMDNILRRGNSKSYARGLPVRRITKDTGGRTVREETYNYSESDSTFSAYVVGSGRKWWSARHYLRDMQLDSVITVYSPGEGETISGGKYYSYDVYGRLSKETLRDSDRSSSRKHYSYKAGTVRPSLIESVASYGNTPSDTAHVLLEKTEYVYSHDNNLWNLTGETRTLFDRAGYGTVTDSIVYSFHDAWGNPRLITHNGQPTTCLWGHKGRYPLAVAKGVSFQDLPATLKASFNGNLSSNRIKALYGLSDAQVNLYEWAGSIGLVFSCDPSGQSEEYFYDGLQRLISIKDANGTELSSFTYGTQLYDSGTFLKYQQRAVNTGSFIRNERKYYDGLGRHWMSEIRNESSTNIVRSIVEQDCFDRTVRRYLPYRAASEILSQAKGEQHDYWGDNAHYTNSYEAGPEGMLSGNRLPGAIMATMDKRTRISRSANSSEEVPLLIHGTADTTVVASGYYPAGTLIKTITVSPDGDSVLEYDTIGGRHVLTRVGDSDTFSIYDLHGRISWVITPAIDSLVSVSISDSLAKESCYILSYDERGNLASLQKAGGGREIFNSYDNARRLTEYTPSASANAGNRLTLRHSYDNLGRITATSLWRDGVTLIDTMVTYRYAATHSVDFIQDDTLVNPYADVPELLSFSQRTGIVESPDMHINGKLILKEQRTINSPVKPLGQQAPGWDYGDGMLGHWWETVTSAYYYDSRGNVVQEVTTWYETEQTRKSFLYDLEGRVLASLEEYICPHEGPSFDTVWIWTENSFNFRGDIVRKKVWFGKGSMQAPNKANALVSFSTSYTYDSVGRPLGKTFNSGGPDISANYTYTKQGWLSKLTYNQSFHFEAIPFRLADFSLFTETIKYWDPEANTLYPRFDGKISEIAWKHSGQNESTHGYRYDNYGRLCGEASFGSGGQGHINTESEMAYDRGGNLTSFARYGSGGMPESVLSMSYTGYKPTAVRDTLSNESWINEFGPDGVLNRDGKTGYCYAENILGKVCSIGEPLAFNSLFIHLQGLVYLPDGTLISRGNAENGYEYMGNIILGRSSREFECAITDDVLIFQQGNTCIPFVKITDHLGNIRALVNLNSGTIEEQSDYYSFGTRIPISSLPANNRHLLAKEDFALNSSPGGTLVDFGARLYNPHIASWTSPDPLGYMSPHISPYSYCNSDPVNHIDPDGEWSIVVYVSSDRKNNPYGTGVLFDKDNNAAMLFEARVEGQHRERLKTDGDTPLGVYRIPRNGTWISPKPEEIISYGPNPRLVMVGESGEIMMRILRE